MGRDIDIDEYNYSNNNNRQIQAFDEGLYNSIRTREITGYNIFRNDDFIGSSTITVYEDDGVSASTEYCYYVTAMYDTGQSYGSDEVCVTSAGMAGDTNGDEQINVQDIIVMVNMIFGLVDPNYQTADLNGDQDVSILDVILLVGMIIGDRAVDATESHLFDDGGVVTLSSDGFIGGVQMSLSHGDDFSIDLTTEALVADYVTKDNMTTLIIAAPHTEHLFTASGDYEIVDMIVANSNEQISVSTPSMFELEAAYPNPFNPSTTMRLHVPVESHVVVNVYNIMGQQVDVLHEGMMQAGPAQLTWNASDLPSGMYIVSANANGYVSSQKIMLLK